MDTDYSYDNLDRITDLRYPAEYGNGLAPRKLVHHNHDVASRLTSLTVDGATHASNIVYNASSQTTSLSVGATGPNQIIESYNYDQQTGLLAGQTVARSSTPTSYLLNLSYDYLRAGTSSGRTGQLTKILNNLNNLNHTKDRGHTYDALGRLTQASGGPSTAPLWTQNYSYDRYGNRTTVSANGSSASLNKRGVDATATASAGSAGILPAVSAKRERTQSEPGAVATGPSDPKVTLPTEQLAASTDIALPDSPRTDAPRASSNSHHASRSARPSPAFFR